MLDIQRLRDHKNEVLANLSKRQNYPNLEELIDEAIATDDQRKALQTEVDLMLAEQNNLSKQIGQLYAQKRQDEGDALKTQVLLLKERSKEVEEKFKITKERLYDLLLAIPNIPHDSVPSGKGEEDNEVYQQYAGSLEDGAKPKPHWELGKELDILDFDLGAKITGSGFPVFKSKGAKLQRALITFFLDEAEKAGYQEIIPPLLVNESSARATGQLPDKEGQMYHMPLDSLYLIPTSEVPVTNILRNETLMASQLPIRMTAYTPCFRREAGSYGADVKGLNRVHQFDKVEIVCVEHPSKSYETLESMVRHVESLLLKLKLPYRILRLCGGDLGFTSALTYDFEVYCMAQKRWLEVSSVSNFEAYQSNRLQLKFKTDSAAKPELTHTLNGSALALARIMAAILENYQDETGSTIAVPEVLVPYTGFEKIGS